MMILQDFKCSNNECEHTFESFEERVDGTFVAKVICPKCEAECQPEIGNPKHHKHLSWSTWNV